MRRHFVVPRGLVGARLKRKLVVEELSEEKALTPADTSSQCQEMIKKAWNREAPLSV